MDNLFGPVLAIVVTGVLLLLRELILSIGKNWNHSYGAEDERPDFSSSDLQHEERLLADSTSEFDERSSRPTPISVDEFFAELCALAQEQSASQTSQTRSASTTDAESPRSNRMGMAEDLW